MQSSVVPVLNSSNKLVYLTSRITVLSITKVDCISIALLWTKLTVLYKYTRTPL